MSKSKQVKNKGHGKARMYRHSFGVKVPKRVAPMNHPQPDLNAMETAATESEKQVKNIQNEELSAPFAIDDTVLVLWDDGCEGVCHYIPRRDLRITDQSKKFALGTKVVYPFRNSEWTGRVPSSMSELIVCCCEKKAIVDIRADSKRQVLVLWDNPSAGACHYMFTKDLRIIDDSHRIERGTRVAFRTKRPIDWTGQVPPAIYDSAENNSLSLPLKNGQSPEMKSFQKLVNSWFPSGVSDQPGENSEFPVIDGFWNNIDKFCRDFDKDDVEYIESRIRTYHRRNRIRSKLFVQRRNHLLESSERKAEFAELCKQSTELLDVIGRESSISEEVSDRSSLTNNWKPLNGLKVNVNGTESSPPSCNSLGSSHPDCLPGPPTDLCSEVDMEVDAPPDPSSGLPIPETKPEGEKALLLNSEHILERLSGSGQSDLMTAANAMVKKYKSRFPITHPDELSLGLSFDDVDDFLTSDESLSLESHDLEEDEVIATIRRKQAELIVIENKNMHALQKTLVLMRQSMERQEIEERLDKVDRRIAELTANLLKYMRLKYKAKPRFKCQYSRDRVEAQEVLVERRRILQELNEFDSKCSETHVNLCGQ